MCLPPAYMGDEAMMMAGKQELHGSWFTLGLRPTVLRRHGLRRPGYVVLWCPGPNLEIPVIDAVMHWHVLAKTIMYDPISGCGWLWPWQFSSGDLTCLNSRLSNPRLSPFSFRGLCACLWTCHRPAQQHS